MAGFSGSHFCGWTQKKGGVPGAFPLFLYGYVMCPDSLPGLVPLMQCVRYPEKRGITGQAGIVGSVSV